MPEFIAAHFTQVVTAVAIIAGLLAQLVKKGLRRERLKVL